jgi:hypothetical protein
MRKKALWVGLLTLLLLVPATAAFAEQPAQQSAWQFDGGRIFTDEDVSLEPGETFDGDLGVFNGDLELPASSNVNGDVFVANGDAVVAGRVNGNVAVLDGDLDLAQGGWVAGDVFTLGGEQEIAGYVRGNLSAVFGDMALRNSAVVEGDLLVAPGSIEREAGAQVMGDEVHDLNIPRIPAIPERPQAPEVPRLTPPVAPEVPRVVPRVVQSHGEPLGSRVAGFVGRLFTAGFLSLVFIALGLLIVFVWPKATHRVSDCIAAMPVQSFGLGLLTFLIAGGLEVLAVVLMVVLILVATVLIGTVILIPIGLLLILLSTLLLVPVPLGLAGAMALGWVGLAELVGYRVLKVLKVRDVQRVGATLVGLLITVALAAILWVFQPVCCAWPFVILLTSVGLGAVAHTRFGRQRCRTSTPVAGAPPDEGPLPAGAMDDEAGRPDVPAQPGA